MICNCDNISDIMHGLLYDNNVYKTGLTSAGVTAGDIQVVHVLIFSNVCSNGSLPHASVGHRHGYFLTINYKDETISYTCFHTHIRRARGIMVFIFYVYRRKILH